MGRIILIFLVLLFWGCSYIDYPDEFVKQVVFTSNIIDVEKMQINSKDELIESVDTTLAYSDLKDIYGVSTYRSYRLVAYMPNIDYYDYEEIIIYIEPLSNKKTVLNKDIYKSGMPIIVKTYKGISKQPVILIKGKPELADSSYKGFTILPVANFGDDGDWDFTYTIRKIKS